MSQTQANSKQTQKFEQNVIPVAQTLVEMLTEWNGTPENDRRVWQQLQLNEAVAQTKKAFRQSGIVDITEEGELMVAAEEATA